MLGLVLVAALAGAPENVDTAVGKVRVQGSGINVSTNLVTDAGSTRLKGDLVVELKRLSSVKVEVLGQKEPKSFVVKEYRILDVGGGTKPLVGYVVKTSSGLALSDGGGGQPVALSISPRTRRRLSRKVGAKVWVSGKELLSGELKVTRYGLLRNPPRAENETDEGDTDEKEQGDAESP